MALEAIARVGDCADIPRTCAKGCRGCQFPFPNRLLRLCHAGRSVKEREAQGQQLNLCAFTFFFFPKEAFNVLAC